MSKKIDKSIVQHHAEALMNKNGSTTTLDVKTALRQGGYFAEQNVVSDFMTELKAELDWDSSSNGKFNTYSIPDPITVSSSNVQTGTVNKVGQVIINMIEKLFSIHKYAMSDKSRIGTDLGLTSIQIEDLALECERTIGMDYTIDLRRPDTTIEDIEKAIIKFNNTTKSVTSTTTSTSQNGRVKVDIDPIFSFGYPTAQCGATDNEIDDLLKQNLVSENDWILSLGNSNTRMIYSGSESRDHVRTAYARKMGDRIQNTRTRRVKNVAR